MVKAVIFLLAYWAPFLSFTFDFLSQEIGKKGAPLQTGFFFFVASRLLSEASLVSGAHGLFD